MADLPSEQPRWADNGGDITPPSEGQRDVGWDDPQSLFREYLNWWMNLVYQWVAWLRQVTHRTSDFSADQALPGGTAPAIGAGRNILANAFSARVFVDGYEQGPTTGPTANYTYSASSDTYWDLTRAGVWVPVIVAAMDPEPAVTADSVRVYMVRTDGSDRTALTDYRRDRVAWTEQIDSTGNLRFTTETYSASGGAEASPSAEVLAFKETHLVDGTAGLNHHAMRSVVESAVGLGVGGVYEYAQIDGVTAPLGVGDNIGRTFVWGARLTAATTWTADKAEVFRLDIAPSGDVRGVRFFRKTGLTPGDTFAESSWDDDLAANTTRMQLPIAAGLKLGGAPFGQQTGANANLTPIVEWVRGAADRTLLTADLTSGEKSCAEYASTDNREIVFNALWNDDTSQWDRTAAGDSWMVVIADNGFRVDSHDSAAASSWGSWTSELAVFDGFVQVYGDLDINGDISGVEDVTATGNVAVQGHVVVADTSLAPVANGIYAYGLRAAGEITADGNNAITFGGTGYGYTAAINGDPGVVRITLTHPIAQGFAMTFGAPDTGTTLFRPHYDPIDASTVDVYIRNEAGGHEDLFDGGDAFTFSFAIFGRN